MPLHLSIENDVTGLLSHSPARKQIITIVEDSADLGACDAALRAAGYGRHLYRGGSHIAIHSIHNGRFNDGPEFRLALITESAPPSC